MGEASFKNLVMGKWGISGFVFCGGTFNLESFLSFEKLSFLNYHELFLRNAWPMKVLFPVGTTVRDPHHHTVPTRCEKIWTCAEAVFGLCWLKLCCSDDHYTKKIEVDPQSWSWKPNWYHLVFMINFEEGLLLPNLFCVVAITTAQIQSTKPAMVPQLWLYRFVNNWNSVLQINILK